MDDPDDPARQDECARRLMAYAAELKAARERGFERDGEREAADADEEVVAD